MVPCSCCIDKLAVAGAMDGLHLAVHARKGAIAAMQAQVLASTQRLAELEGLLGSSQLVAINELLGHCGYTR